MGNKGVLMKGLPPHLQCCYFVWKYKTPLFQNHSQKPFLGFKYGKISSNSTI